MTAPGTVSEEARAVSHAVGARPLQDAADTHDRPPGPGRLDFELAVTEPAAAHDRQGHEPEATPRTMVFDARRKLRDALSLVPAKHATTDGVTRAAASLRRLLLARSVGTSSELGDGAADLPAPLTVADRLHAGLAHAEPLLQDSARDTGGGLVAHLEHLGVGDDGASVVVAALSGAAPLGGHVAAVVAHVAEEEVRGVDAGRVVAAVADSHAVGDRAVVDLVRGAVGLDEAGATAAALDATVAVLVARSVPLPARVGVARRDVAPEAILPRDRHAPARASVADGVELAFEVSFTWSHGEHSGLTIGHTLSNLAVTTNYTNGLPQSQVIDAMRGRDMPTLPAFGAPHDDHR